MRLSSSRLLPLSNRNLSAMLRASFIAAFHHTATRRTAFGACATKNQFRFVGNTYGWRCWQWSSDGYVDGGWHGRCGWVRSRMIEQIKQSRDGSAQQPGPAARGQPIRASQLCRAIVAQIAHKPVALRRQCVAAFRTKVALIDKLTKQASHRGFA